MTQIPHDSALTHVQGLSEYIDDRAFYQNELHVGVFYSEKAHAEILNVYKKEALQLPGVVGILDWQDVAHLHWGTIFQDQPLLAQDKVQFVGEAILVIAAESQAAMKLALQTIRVDYKELPAILSIQEARKQKSFIGALRTIERGNTKQALGEAPYRLKGSIKIQGADHFYLESQAAVAYPTDSGGIEIHSSTQHSTETQHVVAHALGLPYKDVTCIVKRMGGAFGGKESQAAPFAAYAAMVAHKYKRPARIILTKDDDMIMTGKRNPFENEYEVGFDEQGNILALHAHLYSDGGAYADLSTSIMERAMLHSDNSYFIPNMCVHGQVCKTHYHPHTAFRGFGGPKGVAMIEKIIEEIALVLDKDPLEIRKKNCYRPGFDVTHYGQKVENNLLPELFEKLEKSCDYKKRRKEIEIWNTQKRKDFEPLRGLSLTSVKFGIAFTTRFLNQGNALVIIHRDGTVQVSTGATEMGQGVYTRIAQFVADEFGIPVSSVKVMPTSTDKNANTSPTAASSGTDLNAGAALKACEVLRARLAQVAAQLFEIPEARWASHTAGLGTENEVTVDPTKPVPKLKFEKGIVSDGKNEISFVKLVRETYLNRISLSEYGFYSVPNLSFNKITGQGLAFLYFTQGTAATEVSVDPVSGEVKVLRADILMDLGRPINEALDLGQVTGAFIQGLGWMTTENLFYSTGGKLLSHSPSTYKIPSIQDTPRIFNVKLLENHGNTVNVKGTKAVGEPPLLLALSAWTAIQNAIASQNKSVDLSIPATSEVVLRNLVPENFELLDQM